MTQFPSTAILHHTSNKANTQFGLLEGMYALHSLQKWLRAQEPGPNQQRQPSTSSVIAPPKTMWSTELSDEEDNPLTRTSLALQMTSYHFFWTQIVMKTTMGMTLSHAKTKMMESLWKLLINLTHYTMVQSVEENTQCAERAKHHKRTRMQPWATEQ